MDTSTETGLTPAAPKPVKAKRRKYTRRAKPAKAAPNEFPGMTQAGCASGCSEKSCVISGKPYCAHPNMCGLQGAEMHDANAIGRLSRAKKMLAHMVTDKRT